MLSLIPSPYKKTIYYLLSQGCLSIIEKCMHYAARSNDLELVKAFVAHGEHSFT